MSLNDGSSSNSSIIFVPFGDSDCLPPPVFLREEAHLLCSFLAELPMARHSSLTSITLLLQMPRAFTLFVISSHTLVLFLFVRVDVNLLLMILIFFLCLFKYNCALGRGEVRLSRALGRGRCNIFRHVVSSQAHAMLSKSLWQRPG